MLSGSLIGILIIGLITLTYFLPGVYTFIANMIVIFFFLIIYFTIPDFLDRTAEGGIFIYMASVLTLAIPYYQIQNFPTKDHTVSQSELTGTLMGSLAIILVLYIIETRAFSHTNSNSNSNESKLGLNKLFFIGAIYNWLNYTRLFVLNSFFYKDGLKPIGSISDNSKETNYLINEENRGFISKSIINKEN